MRRTNSTASRQLLFFVSTVLTVGLGCFTHAVANDFISTLGLIKKALDAGELDIKLK